MTKNKPLIQGEGWTGKNWGCYVLFKSLIRIRKQVTAQ